MSQNSLREGFRDGVLPLFFLIFASDHVSIIFSSFLSFFDLWCNWSHSSSWTHFRAWTVSSLLVVTVSSWSATKKVYFTRKWWSSMSFLSTSSVSRVMRRHRDVWSVIHFDLPETCDAYPDFLILFYCHRLCDPFLRHSRHTRDVCLHGCCSKIIIITNSSQKVFCRFCRLWRSVKSRVTKSDIDRVVRVLLLFFRSQISLFFALGLLPFLYLFLALRVQKYFTRKWLD